MKILQSTVEEKNLEQKLMQLGWVVFSLIQDKLAFAGTSTCRSLEHRTQYE